MKKTLIVLTVLVALSSMAFAQGGGQRRGGGFFGGGSGILMQADVQKELKLTASQITKIEKAIESNRPERGAGGGGGQRGSGGAGGGGGQRGARTQTLNADLEKDLKGILNETQYSRYHELMLQQTGGFAITREDVAKKLKLTDAQKEELAEVNQDMRADMQDMFSGGGGGGSREEMMEDIQALRADYGKQMVKVLTAAQNKTWTTMLGKKFKFAPRGG